MDKILFSERLVTLRKKRGYDTQYAFAKAYNEKFNPEWRGMAEDGSGILGTIKNYENANHLGIPKLDIVCNLCELLNCDIDYLTGKIPVETHGKYSVMEQTGFSKSAVEKIQQIHSYAHGNLGVAAHGKTISILTILSELITSDGFLKLMNELSFYTLYSQLQSNPAGRDELNIGEYERFHKWADDSGLEIQPRKDIAEMHLQTAGDTLKNIFRDIVKNGSDGIRPTDIWA